MLTLKKIFESLKIEIKKSSEINELDIIRVKYLGKKGILSNCIKDFKNVSFQKKKKYIIVFNDIKKETISRINKKRIELHNMMLDERIKKERIDLSLPGRRLNHGAIHPVNCTLNNIKTFFSKLGFQSIDGFEIEDEYHNFDALNIPKYHPSRNYNDTFWIDSKRLLRTQTSNMQIRIMKKEKPPIRFIFPGKVYRNDYDTTHTPMFHQVEGLIVERNINFANLKWIIYNFLRYFFGKNISIRFRPSYFPFTTPSAEVDIIDNNQKSLEVLGCGMVHPVVLKNVNIDSDTFSACAFGIGVERITMLRYGISDLRLFFENDIRFIKQFKYI